MGAVPSTPRTRAEGRPRDVAEYLIGAFVGEKSYPVTSDFWQKLLELPFTLQWPQERVLQACEEFAQNNNHTRHLAKILIHLVWSLEAMSNYSGSSSVNDLCRKSTNAAYISSLFLKYLIENAKNNKFEELCLTINCDETTKDILPKDEILEIFIMRGILTFIGSTDVSPFTCPLHHELLNLMFVAMSTQLCTGASPGLSGVHPFIDAAMAQAMHRTISCSLTFLSLPEIFFTLQ